MASATADAGPTPTDVPSTQQGGNAKIPRAAPEDWPSLLIRCEDLGITARAMDLEHESVEAALATIDAANQLPAWKKAQRKKLRKKVQCAIAAAEPPPPLPAQPDAMDVQPMLAALPPLQSPPQPEPPPQPPPPAAIVHASMHEGDWVRVGGLTVRSELNGVLVRLTRRRRCRPRRAAVRLRTQRHGSTCDVAVSRGRGSRVDTCHA